MSNIADKTLPGGGVPVGDVGGVEPCQIGQPASEKCPGEYCLAWYISTSMIECYNFRALGREVADQK